MAEVARIISIDKDTVIIRHKGNKLLMTDEEAHDLFVDLGELLNIDWHT